MLLSVFYVAKLTCNKDLDKAMASSHSMKSGGINLIWVNDNIKIWNDNSEIVTLNKTDGVESLRLELYGGGKGKRVRKRNL